MTIVLTGHKWWTQTVTLINISNNAHVKYHIRNRLKFYNQLCHVWLGLVVIYFISAILHATNWFKDCKHISSMEWWNYIRKERENFIIE